jgi:hypothetical protein
MFPPKIPFWGVRQNRFRLVKSYPPKQMNISINDDPGPTHQEIVAYWVRREDECGLGVDWAEAHERCWRCGYKSKLQRCHIVPRSREGVFLPENLVLLCCRCHRDAPNCTDSRLMWIWLRSTNVPFYDTFLVSRAIQEFIRMFGRYPFVGISAETLTSEYFVTLLKDELAKTIVHYGEGRRNPATLACIYARTEERLTGFEIFGADNSLDGQLLMPLLLNPEIMALLTVLPNT